jgi:hypothetical protein
MYEPYSAGANASVRDVVEVADYINAKTPVDATVLFWERPCHVYTLTQCRSPSFAAALH